MSFRPSKGRAPARHPAFASDMQRLRASKLAEVALRRYGLGDAQLLFLRQGFVQVFRVVSPSKGEFVLRLYSTPPVGSVVGGEPVARLRSPDAIRSQLQWLKALSRETELLVPEPVPLADGSLMGYVSFDDLPLRRKFLRQVWANYRHVYHPEHPGRYCVLLRWVPGEHNKGSLGSSDLRLLGSYVAALHNHAQGYRAPKGTVLPRWDWEWVFGGGVPLWSQGEAYYSAAEMEVFRAAARRAHKDLSQLGGGRDAFGVIHRDLKFDNIVFDGARVGAIDFDMCGLGYYLFDLSVIRRVLPRRYGDRLKPLWQAFLEGYRRERPLPGGYERHLRTFEAMQRVAAINTNLNLLARETTRHQAPGRPLLRNAVAQLESNYLQDEGR